MTRGPIRTESTLASAFQEDHVRLGRAFQQLGERLRVGDEAGARAAARELDTLAGAHIAFEEEAFYPRLIPGLGASEIDRLRAEHEVGLDLVRRLVEAAGPLEATEIDELLTNCETMAVHIAECGALFQALGDLSAAERASLCQSLYAWRERAPRWTEWARGHDKA